MNRKVTVIFLIFGWSLLICVMPAHSDKVTYPGRSGDEGFFEVECNIAHIDLHLCPKDNFVKKEVKVFFGLIKSHKEICSVGELSLGTTPLKPVSLPSGKYILSIPPGYVWENQGPIEITILPGKKTYFLLKLFSTRSDRTEDNHGGSGGGGGGGAASGPGP